ncbi:N-acetylmuramoyl-L-alanine amidase [Mammaliicoccus stepanovicii]|uniref:N-acetylmuramoyl-L-alanine amidase n=1 Tax=Mammaliicoccus stepanovicii TaxID=643214 RepID=A0A239Z373_9STAP|nr:N-acetylmuramoyl-L-alanine amidase [Mammaliicoccus stepanovicii]PNZ72398.1 cell wall amidase [Mammaliicoccus stepanovicii]GGI40199.1 putative cell wall amidase LytH [Mammaliicoccus stepanovicii]SNV65502.1 N-acetylmuramoyl-L-alanine amidase [Mammaliicoccus stepanovicii]
MNRINLWFKKYKLKPIPVISVAVIVIILLIVLIKMLIPNDVEPKSLSMIEDGELRTGPAAYYPIIFEVKDGDKFEITDRKGKWFEVTNDDNEKGWIAGWHTNLDIKEDVNPVAKPLKGKTIILDPGHGGGDQGASSSKHKNVTEKEITLKTAQELEEMLKSEGAKVKMTRTKDEYVKLKDRQGDGDVFISIHNDALDSSGPHGVTVYYHHDTQQDFAKTLHTSINQKSILSDRGVRNENFQVIRQTKMPAVLLELGYISNPTDEDLIADRKYRHIVETGIVDGLKVYFSN